MRKILVLSIILLLIASSCQSGSGNRKNQSGDSIHPSGAVIGKPDSIAPTEPSEPDGSMHPSSKPGKEDSSAPTDTDPIQQLMDRMTLREKIGQLFVVAYRQDSQGNPVLKVDGTITQSLKEYQPGGVILFAENISTIPQTVGLIDGFQEASKTPLFVAVDEEGGLVSRITKSKQMHATVFPNNGVIGEKNDPELARDVARAIAKEIASLGFNMNFAPVADINTNSQNPVIGVRAYGSDAKVVRQMVSAAVQGIQEQDVSAVLKHFPGHGDTKDDSHYGTASVSHTRERLFNVEMLPFIDGIENGADGIMTAHILTPEIPGEDVPATMKKEILTDILRNELGYKGLIITDALNMGAITQHFSSDEAAVKAILAGADILLMPEDLPLAVSGLEQACENGQVPMERINASVRRILETKYRRGFFDGNTQKGDPEKILGNSEHRQLAEKASKVQ